MIAFLGIILEIIALTSMGGPIGFVIAIASALFYLIFWA